MIHICTNCESHVREPIVVNGDGQGDHVTQWYACPECQHFTMMYPSMSVYRRHKAQGITEAEMRALLKPGNPLMEEAIASAELAEEDD